MKPLLYLISGNKSIYIPLWCYFNNRGRDISIFKLKFTFHYGVTLIKLRKDYPKLKYIIYIPLWCYFNNSIFKPS